MSELFEMPNGLMARPDTSDEATWHDVFDEDKAYHRPPADITDPNVILDLGAYVGYTTCDYLNLFTNAFIYAFEPDPDNFALLMQNVRITRRRDHPPLVRTRNAILTQGAIWNYDGYGNLTGDAYNAKQIVAGATVSVYTIDNIVQQQRIQKIDFLKMDIEGAEKDVLALGGGWPEITSCIKIECHGEYYVSQCIADLNTLGFQAVQDDKHEFAVIGRRE